MPDTPPARSLVETVARAIDPKFWRHLDQMTAEYGDALWVGDLKLRHQSLERSTNVIKAVLDAIAEPSDAMGRAGLIATNGDSLEGWPDEHRRTALEALGDIGYGDRLSGNPSKWMKPIWRAMIAELRKEIENG